MTDVAAQARERAMDALDELTAYVDGWRYPDIADDFVRVARDVLVLADAYREQLDRAYAGWAAYWARAKAAEQENASLRELLEQAELDTERKVDAELRGRLEAAERRVVDLEAALRRIADHQLTGTERTLHIDFQGIARAVLGGESGAPQEDARSAGAETREWDATLMDGLEDEPDYDSAADAWLAEKAVGLGLDFSSRAGELAREYATRRDGVAGASVPSTDTGETA